VEIVSRVATGRDAGTDNSSGKARTPRLAIIIDDLGSDRAAAEAIFALGYPSLFPSCPITNTPRNRQGSAATWLSGPAPFADAIGGERTPEAQELHPGMAGPEVATLVRSISAKCSDAAGVNTIKDHKHADTALMDELMPVLRDHRLFYVDSRTTAVTVAYDAAQDFGVRSAFRNVPFLDDVREVGAVRKRLHWQTARRREKGEAWGRSPSSRRDLRLCAKFCRRSSKRHSAWCLPLTRHYPGRNVSESRANSKVLGRIVSYGNGGLCGCRRKRVDGRARQASVRHQRGVAVAL